MATRQAAADEYNLVRQGGTAQDNAAAIIESQFRSQDDLSGPAATAQGKCFHCGLPLPKTQPLPRLEVAGKTRSFCCPGCHAICVAIIRAGLTDYYRFRTETGSRPPRETLDAFQQQIQLFDRPEIQRELVDEGDELGDE